MYLETKIYIYLHGDDNLHRNLPEDEREELA